MVSMDPWTSGFVDRDAANYTTDEALGGCPQLPMTLSVLLGARRSGRD